MEHTKTASYWLLFHAGIAALYSLKSVTDTITNDDVASFADYITNGAPFPHIADDEDCATAYPDLFVKAELACIAMASWQTGPTPEWEILRECVNKLPLPESLGE